MQTLLARCLHPLADNSLCGTLHELQSWLCRRKAPHSMHHAMSQHTLQAGT